MAASVEWKEMIFFQSVIHGSTEKGKRQGEIVLVLVTATATPDWMTMSV